MKTSIKLLIATLIVGATSFQLGSRFSKPDVVSQIDSVFVDRQIEVRDTINVYRPFQVTVYDTVETTRVDTIRVADDFNYTGLVASNPITLDRSGLTLTTFDLGRQSFVQQHYQIPRKTWGFSGHTVYTQNNANRGISFEMDIRYKNFTLVPTLGIYSTLGANAEILYGARLRYRLF